MRLKKRITWLLVILAIGFSLSAQAQDDLLFDGGAPDRPLGLRISDIGFVVSAANFEATNEWRVTSAEFWSVEMPDMFEWDGTVSYFVFEDDAGLPSGSPIYSGQAQSIVKTPDSDVNTFYLGFKYSFNFEVPLELEENTIYWLALNLGGGETMYTTQAFWAATYSRVLNNAVISFNLINWSEYDFDLAFRLYGSEGPFISELEVPVDIKPQSCPNPLNVKSKGILPVAILGTADLDVTDIDITTLELNGVAPVRSGFEDVAATPTGLEPCECLALSGDGSEDLTLKFDTQAIVATLGSVSKGLEVPLTLTGNLLESAGGTAIEGSDCVVIKGVK